MTQSPAILEQDARAARAAETNARNLIQDLNQDWQQLQDRAEPLRKASASLERDIHRQRLEQREAETKAGNTQKASGRSATTAPEAKRHFSAAKDAGDRIYQLEMEQRPYLDEIQILEQQANAINREISVLKREATRHKKAAAKLERALKRI